MLINFDFEVIQFIEILLIIKKKNGKTKRQKKQSVLKLLNAHKQSISCFIKLISI